MEKQGWKVVSIPYWISPDRSVTRLRAHVRETLGEKLKVFLPLPTLDAFEEGKKLYLQAEKRQAAQENRKRGIFLSYMSKQIKGGGVLQEDFRQFSQQKTFETLPRGTLYFTLISCRI